MRSFLISLKSSTVIKFVKSCSNDYRLLSADVHPVVINIDVLCWLINTVDISLGLDKAIFLY